MSEETLVLTYFCGQLDTYVLAQYPFLKILYFQYLYICIELGIEQYRTLHKKNQQYRGSVQYMLLTVTKGLNKCIRVTHIH